MILSYLKWKRGGRRRREKNPTRHELFSYSYLIFMQNVLVKWYQEAKCALYLCVNNHKCLENWIFSFKKFVLSGRVWEGHFSSIFIWKEAGKGEYGDIWTFQINKLLFALAAKHLLIFFSHFYTAKSKENVFCLYLSFLPTNQPYCSRPSLLFWR